MGKQLLVLVPTQANPLCKEFITSFSSFDQMHLKASVAVKTQRRYSVILSWMGSSPYWLPCLLCTGYPVFTGYIWILITIWLKIRKVRKHYLSAMQFGHYSAFSQTSQVKYAVFHKTTLTSGTTHKLVGVGGGGNGGGSQATHSSDQLTGFQFGVPTIHFVLLIC